MATFMARTYVGFGFTSERYWGLWGYHNRTLAYLQGYTRVVIFKYILKYVYDNSLLKLLNEHRLIL